MDKRIFQIIIIACLIGAVILGSLAWNNYRTMTAFDKMHSGWKSDSIWPP